MTEIDGLRIINARRTYFLEEVQPEIIDTFKTGSDTPAAKHLLAFKLRDNNDKAGAVKIISEISQENLKIGVERLLDVAKFVHYDN